MLNFAIVCWFEWFQCRFFFFLHLHLHSHPLCVASSIVLTSKINRKNWMGMNRSVLHEWKRNLCKMDENVSSDHYLYFSYQLKHLLWIRILKWKMTENQVERLRFNAGKVFFMFINRCVYECLLILYCMCWQFLSLIVFFFFLFYVCIGVSWVIHDITSWN